MKRRDFLAAAAGLAGTIVPAVGRSQARPCPPPSMKVTGGTSAATDCGVDAESDWLARSTGAGVVWAHDFRNPAEVNNFRFTPGVGTDPAPAPGSEGSYCRHITTDGITGGGCLEIYQDVGTGSRGQWWRPFSPLKAAGNGRDQDDEAAGGSLSLSDWNPRNAGQYQWWNGVYGHADYHASQSQYDWDGTEFYIQLRAKISASRADCGTTGHKLLYIDFGGGSTQELVAMDQLDRVYMHYRSFGATLFVWTDGKQRRQPGGDMDGTCLYGQTGCSSCWCYPWDEWFTLLYQIVPGHAQVEDTRVRVWGARKGESQYTKVWDWSHAWPFESNAPNGWNYLKLVNLLGATSKSAFYHRFDQVILSKQFIPCPLV